MLSTSKTYYFILKKNYIIVISFTILNSLLDFLGILRLEGNFRKGVLHARVREVGSLLIFRFNRVKKKKNKS